jgi:hypothetical protein
MSEIKYEIVKKIGVLSQSTSGWAKEVNLISWNEREPKFDLRDWSADHEKMGKGVTLSREELLTLKEILKKLELYIGDVLFVLQITNLKIHFQEKIPHCRFC